ncbi:MAG: hypothetical protein K5907_03905 [Treponema sp.]|nr:hypothetical protein [Treponema sp.]
MKHVVSIENEEIRLCSGLDEYAFGKTNFNSIVTQTGFIAERKDSKTIAEYTFTPWSFEEIKSFDVQEKQERVVFYCAKNPLSKNAKTMLELFEQAGSENSSLEDKDKMYEASFEVCTILTQAAREGIEIPINGAGGIIADKDKFLFLPQDVFKYAIAGLPAVDQSDNHNCWVNPSLTGLPAICFLRASFAYKMLTGRFAYPASDSITRNADILDKKFLPLELCINGINNELAEEVNRGLKLNSNSVAIPGKKQKGKKSEELVPKVEFPLELLKNARQGLDTKMTQEEFENAVRTYQKRQSSRVNTKRTFRRNTTGFVIGFIAIIGIGLTIRSTYKGYLEDYTTKGLTSTQTIQTFFKGMNNLDVPLVQHFIEGRSASRYLDSISNIYVIGKQRQSSFSDNGYLKPAKFFLVVTNANKLSMAEIYGATNIKIDGKPVDEYIELKKNKDKPQILTQEQGVTINKGDVSVHSVEYYTIHTEGTDNGIFVTKNHDTFTLTFKKNKWIISNIESLSEEAIEFDSDSFKGEYFNLVVENDGDAVKAVKELSSKYDFLPSQKEMLTERKLLEEYLADPYKGIL